MTSGIISALARTAVSTNALDYFIQTDAAINPGNSGGALVSMDGKLVGINSAIYSRDGGSLGIGFAVPSNMVRAVLNGVAQGQMQPLQHPWTGLERTGDHERSCHFAQSCVNAFRFSYQPDRSRQPRRLKSACVPAT